jgi:hypothetical protein
MQPASNKILLNSTIDLADQENARIWSEVEQCFALVKEAGADWLRVSAAAYAVMDDLGYEDMESFEATLGQTFVEWMKRIGVVEFKEDEQGILVFRPIPLPDDHVKTSGFTMTLNVKTKQHLQVVVVKSPDATIYIPEVEFSCGCDGKTQIDTIYNNIAGHIFNLELFSQKVDEERCRLLLETVDQLRKCLDLDMEWHFVLVDPTGVSEMDAVEDLVTHNYVDIPEWADSNV